MSEQEAIRLKCPECGEAVRLWTDLHQCAQAMCPACDWSTFDAAVDL